MTLGQETRWAYSTQRSLSLHGAKQSNYTSVDVIRKLSCLSTVSNQVGKGNFLCMAKTTVTASIYTLIHYVNSITDCLINIRKFTTSTKLNYTNSFVAPFITANYHKSAYIYIYDDKHVKWRERLMFSKASINLCTAA